VLRERLRDDIPITEHDQHVNDPEFGRLVARLFLDLLPEAPHDVQHLPQRAAPDDGDEEFRSQFRSWALADLSYVDIRKYLETKDLVLVPMASTEQHGPHLPLYTDTITAVEVSARISEHIGVLHTPPLWAGYSPQHMHEPGQGRGTITLRSSTLLNLMYDVARSLIHHGFDRVVFVNGHGSNTKVVDPVLRRLRYETGAMIGFVKPYMERYTGILEGLMENPPEETPGWHSSELETSQDMAWNPDLVRMERRSDTRATIPDFLPESFRKSDGAPTSSSRATSTSASRWTTTSSSTAAPSATRCGPRRRRARRRSGATPSTSRAASCS
jgi:creatinine amidohydrolase